MRSALLPVLISGSLAWASAAAAQGPIPPLPVPEYLQESVEGYSMAVPFQKWGHWVERQRGAAIEAALAQRPVLEGERQIGRPLLSVAYHGDLGIIAMGEIRVFCPQAWVARSPAEICHYLYRLGSARKDATLFGSSENEVSRWTWENFNPALVVAALKEAGIAPGADLWRVDGPTLFATHPSAVAMLGAHLQIVTVDSRDCPALHEAVQLMDRSQVAWRTDFMAVGHDDWPRAPNPHAVTASYTLEIFAGGGQVTLKGDGEGLRNIVNPALQAAARCSSGNRSD